MRSSLRTTTAIHRPLGLGPINQQRTIPIKWGIPLRVKFPRYLNPHQSPEPLSLLDKEEETQRGDDRIR